VRLRHACSLRRPEPRDAGPSFDREDWAKPSVPGFSRHESFRVERNDRQLKRLGNVRVFRQGKMIFRPEDGLVITNQTQGWRRTIPRALNATVKQEEIFVFCMSKSFTEELRERFEAVACVEILNGRAFCEKIESALPAKTTFPGKPGREPIGQAVTYYEETDDCNTATRPGLVQI
jgi:hypothetical protein